jgi:predicted O-methyltransferase YrrM
MQFCPVLDLLLTENRTVGRSGKEFTNLASNSTLNNLRFIQQVMRERKPERTLEVGLAYGASTLVFCSEHKRLGRIGNKQHIAIDPFQRRHWYDEAGVFAVERAGLADYLHARFEFSEFVLPRLLEADERFDFIYIDGSHLFENVFVDAFYSARLLSYGGWLALDDSSDPHVAKVNDFIRSNLTDTLIEVSLGTRSVVAGLLGRRQLTVFKRLPLTHPRQWDAPLRAWDSKLGRF